jgi:hypothetical protein
MLRKSWELELLGVPVTIYWITLKGTETIFWITLKGPETIFGSP